jgi:hypothetical protein
VGRLTEQMNEPERIEDLYGSYRNSGGQTAQWGLEVNADRVVQCFTSTVMAIDGSVQGIGGFHDERKALRDLAVELAGEREARGRDHLRTTHHLTAELWEPTRWKVEKHPDLDFHYLDREITPGRGLRRGAPKFEESMPMHVSLDLLLANANPEDRTPIVAEAKIGADENAELGLVQALAGAAQLSTAHQRKRLREVYWEHLGKRVPKHVDVYIIGFKPPLRGVKPKLFRRALELAAEIMDSGALSNWVRRIVFLEAELKNGTLTFRLHEHA